MPTPTFHGPKSTLAGALCVWLALHGLSSCSLLTSNEQAKRPSLEPWKDVRIEGEPATEFLEKRTAMLIIGADALEPDPQASGLARPTLRGETPTELEGGAALAIDARGYWLTAAHCVETGPILLVTRSGSTTRHAQARVVWSGTADGEDLDLALLHAPIEPFGVLRWSATRPSAGPVLCAGSGLGSDRFSAGNIKGVGARFADTGFVLIYHDAPITPGDSGGPAIAPDGTLVGVDTEGSVRYLGRGQPSSTAVLPEEQFVRRLIDEDVGRSLAR